MEEGVAGHLYSFRMPGYIEWFKFRRFGLTTSMETGKIGWKMYKTQHSLF
jgi:hypothetical protein